MKTRNSLGIIAALLFAKAGVAGPAGTPHYPDLVTLVPSDLGIEYNSGTGQKLLRFSNLTANLGEGPLEVIPVNNASNGTTDAYQVLYSHDANGNWYPVATNHVGTFVFHPAHNHWHFENFARYELHNMAADGSVGGDVFASAEKISFCLVDDTFLDPVLEHAGAQSYTNCNQVNPQGISVGWVDVYPWTLPDQYLDITAIPDGEYWLVSTADPDNLIDEGGGAAENNNTAAVKVRIASDLIWVDDAVPVGAATGASGGDSWKWIGSDPAPFSGTLAHQSAIKAGLHEHFFDRSTETVAVNTNNTLFTYVYLDPANPPGEVMLQWADTASFEHRAYWGGTNISLGTDGTPSRRYMGPLPPVGQWVRLEVPASLVGLEGHTLRGMRFTLYDGRATWDYSDVHVAPPSTNATPPALTNTAVPPIISAYTISPFGISVGVTDGTTQLDTNSIKLTFDGAVVARDIIGEGAHLTTIKFDVTAPLASGSGHSVKLEFADSAIPSVTRSYNLDFVVSEYALVPPEFATAPGAVDETMPGFKIRPYQTDAKNPNSLEWTEDQLAGLKGANLANLAGTDANGYFARELINFDLEGGAGNFPNDEPFPGLPGSAANGGTNNLAIEVLSFLEFPNPGLYVMGVNSEDGFRVTTGANALDKFSVRLGEFDGVRGPVDTIFTVVVSKAGIYPFRLIWENGSGSANVEWFTVTNGVKVLVNDTNSADSIKAYREGSTRAYVKAVSPLPGAVDVPGTNSISIALADGTLQVQNGSIQLFLNGQRVEPATNTLAGITTVTYTPPTGFAPESTNTVRLVYADNASPPNVSTNEFSFVVAPDFDTLIGINPTQQWRYNQSGSDLGTAWKATNFNDSSWPPGFALFEGKSGSAVPELPEPVRTGLIINSSVTTYYFRTHFNFTGNPGGARLRMRHIIDDGAVFYLNGAEIHRIGMPAGPISASTPAARTVIDAVYEGPVDLPIGSLVSGDNVLAVEVHQVSSTSSDITMGVELISITSNPLRTTIASLSPAPDSLDVPRDTAIDITLGDGTQHVQPGTIQLFVDGQSVMATVSKPAGSPWTTIHYRPDQILPAETRITVKLVFDDDATPPNVTTREFSFTTAPEITVLVAIDDRQSWRYDESGLDQGTAWKETRFDDSSWKSGYALFEGKNGTVPLLPEPVRTTLTVSTNKTTFYFRTHFNFPGNPTTARLRIKPIIDDGALVYLNGSEIFGLGMPGGVITASTLASRTVVDAVYEGPFSVPSTGLLSGDNVLAVEVHQRTTGSSDITMGLQLLMLGSFPKFTTVALLGTSLKFEWTGSGTLQAADAVTGPWTDVMNASSPFTAALIGTAKFYRLKL